MASLKAMFRLYDGYSTTIDKINRKTDEATNKILKASGSTDKFNSKLNATGASANNASSGLGKFISVAAMVAGALKGINITDEYTNTAARLGLITKSLEEQKDLQADIFAAADRAKGSYASMASAISKMGLMAGEAFGSNDELVTFTELIQKSFKVGGANQSEQASAMLQLTQAMSAGKLQGDEFRSIMENAPMIADAIAKYTGKSKGELKELSADGLITSDIIKNAMFMAANDINTKFGDMPLTFADIWNKIKNGGLKAFSGLMEKINKLINTEGFQNFINGVIAGFSSAAQGAEWLVDAIINGWDTIGPILGLITGVYLVAMIVKLWAMVPPLIAQAIAWLSIYWPILLIIGIIAIAISAARQFGVSWEDILGFVGGIIGTFAAAFYNQFVNIWNFIAAFINFFGNVFRDPVTAIDILIMDLVDNVLGHVETMVKGIEDLINLIPGVEIDITSGLSNFRDNIAEKVSKLKDESGYVEYAKKKDYMDYSEGFTMGGEFAKKTYSNFAGAIDNLTNKTEEKGTGYDPTVVKGIGSGGKLEVDMSKEDLQYLRDIAEREYINKFSTATLAPNVTIKFGNIHKEADANQVAGRIKKILQEEIATAAEGAY